MKSPITDPASASPDGGPRALLNRRHVLAGAAAATLASGPLRAAAALLPERLATADLLADHAIVEQTLRALHPGLWRYNSDADLTAGFAALRRAWSRDQPLAPAYLALSLFLATLRCGHSYGNFYNQTAAVTAQLFRDIPRLPARFVWIDGRMVVTADQGDPARLAPGTVITSVNGVDTRTLLRQLLPLVRADGHNDAKRRALLAVTGGDRWESFDIYLALLYPGWRDYRCAVVRPDGRRGEIVLPPIDHATRYPPPPAKAKDAALWRLDYPQPATARLTMPDWAVYNSTWDWQGWLDRGFAEIAARGCTALVVDLRGNEGGNDCGDDVLARLIDAPISRAAAADRLVRFQTIPPGLKPYLDTWDRSFDRLGEGAAPAGPRFFRLGDPAGQTIVPRGPRFRGKLLVLTGPDNSSATFQFIAAVRERRLGTLIGAPTGGNLRGINGGSFYFVRLPHSRLEFDLPLVGLFPRAPQPDAGIVPDLVVEASAQDIAAGRDPVLERALALAR